MDAAPTATTVTPSTTITYGLEFVAAKSIGARDEFRWYTSNDAGLLHTTALEAHTDALARNFRHGGFERDLLLGADLWGSYTYACGIRRVKPVTTIGMAAMRVFIAETAGAYQAGVS